MILLECVGGSRLYRFDMPWSDTEVWRVGDEPLPPNVAGWVFGVPDFVRMLRQGYTIPLEMMTGTGDEAFLSLVRPVEQLVGREIYPRTVSYIRRCLTKRGGDIKYLIHAIRLAESLRTWHKERRWVVEYPDAEKWREWRRAPLFHMRQATDEALKAYATVARLDREEPVDTDRLNRIMDQWGWVKAPAPRRQPKHDRPAVTVGADERKKRLALCESCNSWKACHVCGVGATMACHHPEVTVAVTEPRLKLNGLKCPKGWW